MYATTEFVLYGLWAVAEGFIGPTELSRILDQLAPYKGWEYNTSLICYHLKKLVKTGLVERVNSTYRITDKGLNVIGAG